MSILTKAVRPPSKKKQAMSIWILIFVAEVFPNVSPASLQTLSLCSSAALWRTVHQHGNMHQSFWSKSLLSDFTSFALPLLWNPCSLANPGGEYRACLISSSTSPSTSQVAAAARLPQNALLTWNTVEQRGKIGRGEPRTSNTIRIFPLNDIFLFRCWRWAGRGLARHRSDGGDWAGCCFLQGRPRIPISNPISCSPVRYAKF